MPTLYCAVDNLVMVILEVCVYDCLCLSHEICNYVTNVASRVASQKRCSYLFLCLYNMVYLLPGLRKIKAFY